MSASVRYSQGLHTLLLWLRENVSACRAPARVPLLAPEAFPMRAPGACYFFFIFFQGTVH